jgi:ABC-type transport system involved in multi-copper enzyme maturation permease subunit
MHRTLVILRYTFLEAVFQPIYSLLLYLGIAIIGIHGMLPFFTLGEDTAMFKLVSLDIILILVLISTLFATSKSIHSEIEDRTMLTLMSKPVRRVEVMVGKYLGIILSAALGVAVLGTVLILCTVLRIPSDQQPALTTHTVNDQELKAIHDLWKMNVAGLLPSLVLLWLQICTLAAVGVAVSTRMSLVVNLPVVIILYIAGNLARFLLPFYSNDPGAPLAGDGMIVHFGAWVTSLVLPFLVIFDLRDRAVLGTVAVSGTSFALDSTAVAVSTLWTYVAVASLYAISYVTFALSVGMWLFENRELGGGEE